MAGSALRVRAAIQCRTVARIAIVVMSLCAAPAGAQAPSALTGPEIEAAFAGKTFRVVTRRIPIGDPGNPTGVTTRTDGAHAEIDLVVRPDRTIIYLCTRYARDGSSAPCRPISRDVGVWTVEGESFCHQALASGGGRKRCYAVIRDGADFRLRLTSGGPPSMIDGERLVAR